MEETQVGYRAFPEEISHPAKARRLLEEDFDKLERTRIDEAPSECAGHLGTVIWYCGQQGYLVQVRIEGRSDVFVFSLCTFTPKFGMDRIDGLFAQDIEAYVLKEEFGFETTRLHIFAGRDSVPIEEYLRNRGAIK